MAARMSIPARSDAQHAASGGHDAACIVQARSGVKNVNAGQGVGVLDSVNRVTLPVGVRVAARRHDDADRRVF